MTKLKYKIKLPVGDWSDDGHGQCDYYYLFSNLPIESLFKLQQLANEKLGFNIGDMCRNYEEDTLRPEMVEKFKEVGITNFFPQSYRTEYADFLKNENLFEEFPMDTEDLAHLWMACIKYVEPSFEYNIEDTRDVPMFCNWTDPDRNPNFNTPGYGMFET